MALFVVNRYLGENAEEDSNNLNSSPKDGLNKLLTKIEERRKLKEQQLQHNFVEDPLHGSCSSREKSDVYFNENNNTLYKKNKRKRKLIDVDNDSNVDGKVEEENEQQNLGRVKKQNKKRAKENNFKETVDESDISKCGVIINEGNFQSEKIVTAKRKSKEKKLSSSSSSSSSSTSNLSNELEGLYHNNENKDVKVKKKRKNKNKNKEEGGSDEKAKGHIDIDKVIDQEECHHEESDNVNEQKNDKVNQDDNGFMVIGGHNFKQKSLINRVLPEWLSKPIMITGSLKDVSIRVDEFKNLDEILVRSLKKNNIEHFFPVQQQVIPWVLSERHCSGPSLKFWPRDICVSAPTGSGKTLAFVLPIIQCLRKSFIRRIRALVVVPVQDLAIQVAQVFAQYTDGTRLQVLSVTGKAMPLQQEQKLLVCKKVGVGYKSLVDIIVTTPGRLVEHIKETPGFSLHHLKFLVIDEADRVIDNFKNDWLYHLENHISNAGIGSVPPLSLNSLKQLPIRPQKLLFSATLTQDPEKLKQVNLFQPRLFVYRSYDYQGGKEKSARSNSDILTKQIMKPSELEELWINCDVQLKPIILYHILSSKNWRGVLCFTHFTDATHRLARLLHHLSHRHGLNLCVEEISSERSFNDRHHILNNFRAGKVDVLVCSDIYARGMDIVEVRYVVLYSPPVHVRNYIHQIGRTARAGMKGTALTLVTPTQIRPFNKMLKSTGNLNLTEITVLKEELGYLEKPYKKSLHSLKKETLKEKEAVKERLKIAKRRNFISRRTIKKNERKNKNRSKNVNKGKKKE